MFDFPAAVVYTYISFRIVAEYSESISPINPPALPSFFLLITDVSTIEVFTILILCSEALPKSFRTKY